jgi:hypothetical protein
VDEDRNGTNQGEEDWVDNKLLGVDDDEGVDEKDPNTRQNLEEKCVAERLEEEHREAEDPNAGKDQDPNAGLD